jgi:hypothetical protein
MNPTMPRLLCTLIALLGLSLLTHTASAQTSVTTLDRLEIELWPDYDRPDLLVLLTGVLPPGTAMPATLQIPIPADAEINAVARISDTSEMIDDITYDTETAENDQQLLTFSIPDLRFRVEYYVPYTITENEHRFAFTWQSDLDILSTAVLVQQPLNALNFLLDPPAPTVQPRDEGISYHVYAEQPTVPGQPFTVQGSYTLSPNQPSAVALSTAQAAGNPPGSSTAVPVTPQATTPSILTNWPAILAAVIGLALLALAGWQFLSRRGAAAAPARKPTPRRAAPTTQPGRPSAGNNDVRFCHSCGHTIEPGDRFCRNCGTTLKQ